MYRFLFSLCLALAPLAATAQKADAAQTEAVSATAECLALGLPEKWKQLQVIIQLKQPYADDVGVLYMVTLPDGRVEPFTPCDPRVAPIKLVALRDSMPEKDRGWTKLILSMRPDAGFDLKYEYPAPPAKK
jgi:hypothetical protein